VRIGFSEGRSSACSSSSGFGGAIMTRSGIVLALLSAALFGANTPLAAAISLQTHSETGS
jgi:hypothetical protein